MPQDRMLRERIRVSEKVNSWPIPLRYFWSMVWLYCDDHGRGRFDARFIVADMFPIDDEVTVEVVARWMQALERAGVIHVYEVEGKKYFECKRWSKHQELAYLRKTDIPDPSGVIPKAGKYSEKFQNISELSLRREGEEKEKRSKGEGANALPRHCPKHPEGTDKPCRPCQTARLKFEAAQGATVSGIQNDPVCAHHLPPKQCPECREAKTA